MTDAFSAYVEPEIWLRRQRKILGLVPPFVFEDIHGTYQIENAFGTSPDSGVSELWSICSSVETTGIPFRAPTTVAAEVRQLRDSIHENSRLTRKHIARALGVDRRSLSGWASGDIRPTADRLRSLRFLAWLADDLNRSLGREPSRVREALLSEHDGASALDAIAQGAFDQAVELATIGGRKPRVRVSRRGSARPMRYAAAIDALRTGDLEPMTRTRTVRPASAYEIDPENSRYFGEPEREGPRRTRDRNDSR